MTTIFWFIKLTRNRIRSNVWFWLPIPFSFHGSNNQIRKYEVWISQFFLWIRLLLTKSITWLVIKWWQFGFVVSEWVVAWTTDAQWSLFLLKSRTFWLVKINWADKFWGIWGIFVQTFSTQFGTVSPLNIFFPLFNHNSYKLFIWDWDLNLNLGCKELLRYLAFVCP